MRTLLLILTTVCSSLIAEAQFAFKPDSVAPRVTALGLPDLDSIQFELRLWHDITVVSMFTQLTFNKNNKWNYRTGFLNHNAELAVFPGLKTMPDLSQLWKKLDSLGVLTLESQNIVTATLVNEGKAYKLDYEKFEQLIPSDASQFRIELFTRDGYKTYSYLDPVGLLNKFKNSNSNWIAPEHERFVEIIKSVNEAFNLPEEFAKYLKNYKQKVTTE